MKKVNSGDRFNLKASEWNEIVDCVNQKKDSHSTVSFFPPLGKVDPNIFYFEADRDYLQYEIVEWEIAKDHAMFENVYSGDLPAQFNRVVTIKKDKESPKKATEADNKEQNDDKKQKLLGIVVSPTVKNGLCPILIDGIIQTDINVKKLTDKYIKLVKNNKNELKLESSSLPASINIHALSQFYVEGEGKVLVKIENPLSVPIEEEKDWMIEVNSAGDIIIYGLRIKISNTGAEFEKSNIVGSVVYISFAKMEVVQDVQKTGSGDELDIKVFKETKDFVNAFAKIGVASRNLKFENKFTVDGHEACRVFLNLIDPRIQKGFFIDRQEKHPPHILNVADIIKGKEEGIYYIKRQIQINSCPIIIISEGDLTGDLPKPDEDKDKDEDKEPTTNNGAQS